MIDLHTHTLLRRLPRSQPVCQVPRDGVEVTATIDPDPMAGVREALATGAAVGVVVPGIEFSSRRGTYE